MKTQAYYLRKAEENFPKMYHREVRPECQKRDVAQGDSFVLDLGDHCVGHFSFAMDNVDDFISAPVKLTLRFGEDMREIDDDFSAYHGWLCKTWLQEEIVVLDYPQKVSMPRRYSCRYIKITVDAATRPVMLYDFCFTASTSANVDALKPADISDPILRKIDQVSINTLKECLQTFFEDGPKRDRRMWIGDLRLEALANYYTFDNRDTLKRSLYLFAAGEPDALGFMPSYIYETPYFFSGRDHIADYALLYVVTVCDYFEHTKDLETVTDLLDVCKAQMESIERILDENRIVTPQEGWFTFIDWCPGLKCLTALQGVYLYTIQRFADLLEAIGDREYKKYQALLVQIREASKKYLYDAEKGLFVNDLDEQQLSVHSQVWMILGGAIEGEVAADALHRTLRDPGVKQPVTPYMRHYVIEAMLKLGFRDEAIAYIKNIWGGMIELGADTFYEVYVPGDRDFSPYGDRMANSLCHAWSCTPTYFIRKYNLSEEK